MSATPLPEAKSRAFFSHSFYIFIARFFPSLATLLVLLYYSRMLPQGAYGLYQNFWIQLYVFYPIACFGIHIVAITYPPGVLAGIYRRIGRGSRLLYYIWIAAVGAVFAVLQYLQAGIFIALPFLFLIGYAIGIILESLLIIHRRYFGLTFINVGYSAVFCLLHWYAQAKGYSLQVLFALLLLLVSLRTILYAIAVLPMLRRQAAVAVIPLPINAIRSLWLHLGIYDITQNLFSWIDKFAVALVLTASLSAVYYNGSQNIPFLPLLLSAAGSAILIQAAGQDRHSGQDLVKLMNRSGRVLSCIVFPLFFFLLFFRYQLFAVLLPRYIAAVPVFMVSVLVLPLRAYSFTTVLQRMHKGAAINIGSIADLVIACALMYPFYRWLGLPGIALAFVITTYLQAAFYLFYAARLLGVSAGRLLPVASWLIKLIVFALLFIAIHYVGIIYATPFIALILGGIAAVISISVSLGIELYAANDNS